MNKPKLSTVLIGIGLFLVFFILCFPYQNLRGTVFAFIQKNTGITMTSEDLSPTFFGWPGVKLKKVDVSIPMGSFNMDVACEQATVRVGLSGLFPPAPGVSLYLKKLRKGGDLYLDIAKASSYFKVDIEANQVNLEQFNLGMGEPLQGSVDIDGSVTYNLVEIAKSSGALKLNIKKLRLPGQNLQGIVLPAVPFGDVTSTIQIRNGMAEIGSFKFGEQNSDFRGNLLGSLRLGTDLYSSFLNLTLNIQLSERYRQDPQSATLVAFLQGYQTAIVGEFSMKWAATIRDMTTNLMAAIPQKAQ